MPKSYADLLREARDQIPEVSVQELDALEPGSATIVDVREASEWEQGYIPGAQHVSKSYIEQQIEGAAPDRSAPVILYCAGGIRSLFAGQTLAEMGYSDVRSLRGGFQAWKGAGLDFDTPVVLSAEQKQRYSRHLLIP
jgi:adenylyltransferase/sulfurtransferase